VLASPASRMMAPGLPLRLAPLTMRAIPYALSVHHFINTVGADAGFAAIIGLAIVVLLFFAHARETATLRRRADESEDALHRLELYVDQIARAGVGPATAPAPAAAQIAAARVGSGAPVIWKLLFVASFISFSIQPPDG